VTLFPLATKVPSQSCEIVEPLVLSTLVQLVTAAELPLVRVTDAQ
jgi:hypothetical protein